MLKPQRPRFAPGLSLRGHVAQSKAARGVGTTRKLMVV